MKRTHLLALAAVNVVCAVTIGFSPEPRSLRLALTLALFAVVLVAAAKGKVAA